MEFKVRPDRATLFFILLLTPISSAFLFAQDGPKPLEAKPRRLVKLAIGLPSVDEPRLDLELIACKNLNTHAVEEPRRVGRDIGGLVGPVVELVIAEKSHV